MICTVEELRQYISTDETDSVLEAKLQALELLIRKYTNNNFQNRNIRLRANVDLVGINGVSPYLKAGDSVEISQSKLNAGLYTIDSIADSRTILDKALYDEADVLITKIEYPMDVVLGVANMIKWDLENRSKIGIQSETLSRHSVTYFNMDGTNSLLGFPKALTGFLEPYMKARF